MFATLVVRLRPHRHKRRSGAGQSRCIPYRCQLYATQEVVPWPWHLGHKVFVGISPPMFGIHLRCIAPAGLAKLAAIRGASFIEASATFSYWVVSSAAHTNIRVAAKPRIVRTACSLAHFSISLRLLESAFTGSTAISSFVGRHDAENCVRQVCDEN